MQRVSYFSISSFGFEMLVVNDFILHFALHFHCYFSGLFTSVPCVQLRPTGGTVGRNAGPPAKAPRPPGVLMLCIDVKFLLLSLTICI